MENDFMREYSKVQSLEEITKKLGKDAKKMSENTSMYGRSSSKVGHDMNITITDYEEECFALEEFSKTMKKADQLSQDKASVIQKTMVDPLKKYSLTFGHVNMQVKNREKLQQDYKKLQGKLDKLKDKDDTGPNMVKKQNIKKELQPVQKEFDEKDRILLREMPEFYNDRLKYMQPIFEALIMAQCWHHQELQNVFDGYLKSVQCDSDSNDKLSDDIKNTLEEIRSLSITSDDK